MKPATQRRVDDLLRKVNYPMDGEWTGRHFDIAEALYVFAHDCGEYQLVTQVQQIPFKGHPGLATGDDRGLTDEGLELYRELLRMEGLATDS